MQIYQSLYGLQGLRGGDTVKIDDAVLGVKNWFYGRSERCLLVFDSADSNDDENDPAFIDLKYFLPNASSVHITIPTRSFKAKGMTSLPPIEVGYMVMSEAVELFSTCSEHDRAANQAKIEMIVQELALYDGAVGARGIHELRSYIGQETLFDNNKYTITSTYHHSGLLTMYTTHPTASESPTNPINGSMAATSPSEIPVDQLPSKSFMLFPRITGSFSCASPRILHAGSALPHDSPAFQTGLQESEHSRDR